MKKKTAKKTRPRRAKKKPTTALVSSKPRDKPDEFAAFQMWMATPKKQRSPTTQKALAKMLKVSDWTLTNWKSDPSFWEGVGKAARQVFQARLADVVNGLADAVVRHKQGWVSAAELYLKAAGVIGEGTGVGGIQAGVLMQMSVDERGQLQASIMQKFGLTPMADGVRSGDLEGGG